MSQFRVEVVAVEPRPHENADTLAVVELWGYTAVVRKNDFPGPGLGVYVPPDSLVPVSEPEFAFLRDRANADGLARIKVTRLRGVVSQGLLVPARPGFTIGQDVASELGVTHYEPRLPLTTTGEDETPPGRQPKYDVEHWRRYRNLLRPGEPVIVSEKVHGASARYCHHDGRMYASSHASWKKYNPVTNVYWRALAAHPEIGEWCATHPDWTVYAEVYGQVQDLKYGAGKNDVRLAVFDLWHQDRWIDAIEARAMAASLPWVPTVYQGDYDPRTVVALAEGPSLVPGASHLREGVVVKPLAERLDPDIGRVCLKIISNAFLERS